MSEQTVDLLLELGAEEIPARFLADAEAGLARAVEEGLRAAGLAPATLRSGATPRRLAVWAGGLPRRQADQAEERTGPAEAAAYAGGAPTQAALKFAESMGVPVDALELREVTKGKKTARYLWARRVVPGRPTLEVVAELLPRWIEAIPWKKSMRWVPGSKARFARPLRRIVALLGGEVVPAAWAGVTAGRATQGHRFLAPDALELADASWEAYVARLRAAHVVVDPAARRAAIEDALSPHLGPAGLERRRALVDEVAGLVEEPLVDVGAFDPRYLRLPRIVIEEAMTGHQRFFPLEAPGAGGALAPRFAYVANRPFDPVIRQGNERVLAARLDDALFFFELDQKTPLDQRIDRLDEVVFMQELGSYKARIARVDGLALEAAKAAGFAPEDAESPRSGTRITRSLPRGGALPLHLHLAAQLARTDLTTEVVQEMPALQGEMGAIYARLQGQPDEVADAIREAWLPRGEGGALPETRAGMCLALADRLDTIVCAFATGRAPTGSKDPFMVRRSVLGVLRILRERGLDLGYGRLVRAAVAALPDGVAGDRAALERQALDYFRERLAVMMVEGGGRHELVRAVLGAGRDPTNVLDAWARLDALQTLGDDPGFGRLFELVERTRNITQKNAQGVDAGDVDAGALEHPAERALWAALEGCRDDVRGHVAARRYVEAGRAYAAALAGPVHTFFEPAPAGVFVMDEDARRRTNRLALLLQVRALLAEGFADLAEARPAK